MVANTCLRLLHRLQTATAPLPLDRSSLAHHRSCKSLGGCPDGMALVENYAKASAPNSTTATMAAAAHYHQRVHMQHAMHVRIHCTFLQAMTRHTKGMLPAR